MKSFGKAMACTGAVIGAGFASGREIAVFFSKYGVHGWWLTALACVAMGVLCDICLLRCGQMNRRCWIDLFEEEERWKSRMAQLCTILLMIVTAGAMIAASGQLAALVWACGWADPLGAAATLTAAYLLGYGSMKPMSWLSAMLTVLFVLVICAAIRLPSEQSTVLASESSAGEMAIAALRAVAYASMNLALAIGIVCRCSSDDDRQNHRTALCFGLIMFTLMCLSHGLYSRHPEWIREGFPILRATAAFGRSGFLTSALLVYLSVFTSLTAVMYALRCAVEQRFGEGIVQTAVVIGLPVVVSCAGFTEIVDKLYAPCGMLCLLLVFAPLLKRRSA